jgi:hypothetical protein
MLPETYTRNPVSSISTRLKFAEERRSYEYLFVSATRCAGTEAALKLNEVRNIVAGCNLRQGRPRSQRAWECRLHNEGRSSGRGRCSQIARHKASIFG